MVLEGHGERQARKVPVLKAKMQLTEMNGKIPFLDDPSNRNFITKSQPAESESSSQSASTLLQKLAKQLLKYEDAVQLPLQVYGSSYPHAGHGNRNKIL